MLNVPGGWLPGLVLGAASYGAAVGWLLPRLTYRLAVDAAQPLRRHCPQGHLLLGPARGWVGPARCAPCTTSGGGRYGPRTAVVVAASGSGCAGLAAAVGARPELAVWLVLLPFLVVAATVDWQVRRLPDMVTLPLVAVTVVLLGAAGLLPDAGGSWTDALLGGVAVGGFYFVLFLLRPAGIGFGDVKLSLTMGLVLGWYGWPAVFAGTFLGFVLALGYGLALVLGRRAHAMTALPLGPFMAAGALLGLLGAATAA